MSARSRRFRTPGDPDDIVGTARGHTTVPRHSAFYSLIATDYRGAGTIARLTLGLVMLPHALQSLFGWFGGPGLNGAIAQMTQLGLAGWLATGAVWSLIVGTFLLILGAFTRIGALAILAVMVGAIVFVHAPFGFFMNWMGQQAGEGFEYHLLAIGLALVALVAGGGIASVDRLLMWRRTAEGGSLPDPVTRD